MSNDTAIKLLVLLAGGVFVFILVSETLIGLSSKTWITPAAIPTRKFSKSERFLVLTVSS